MIATSRPQFAAAILFAVSLLGVSIPQAHAQLTLTPAGIADGFTLVPFVSGYNFNGNYGPLAQGILPNGNVITGSVGDGKVYVFPDSNNLTLGSNLFAAPYACQTGNCNFAMATAGGQVYGAQAFGGTYEHFNSNGTFSPIPGLALPSGGTLTSFLGMWGDPVNGHLISASNSGLVDIDPVAGTFRVINASVFPDGVTVSADGKTIYVENGGTIQSYNLNTGAFIQQYNTGHSPDGTGVIIGGQFDGDVIVNDNDGTVGLLDPKTSAFTIIADGPGSTRGDFVSVDTSNGTLFLSQFLAVDRLGCGPGCSIGVTPGVPEPSTWAMMLLGFLGLGFMFRQRRIAAL